MPEFIAQHRDRCDTLDIVLRSEGATEVRPHPKHREVATGDVLEDHLIRAEIIRDAAAELAVGRDIDEPVLDLSEFTVGPKGDSERSKVGAIPVGVLERGQPLRLEDPARRTIQQPVHGAVDGRRRTDSQRQRNHANGEARSAEQRSRSVPDVSSHILQEGQVELHDVLLSGLILAYPNTERLVSVLISRFRE
jgi:hypothetical protein